MIPIYLLIGLINVLAKHNNYGIKINDPEFHVKVRRSLQDTATDVTSNLYNNLENQLGTDVTRTKRYAYYRKTSINKNESLLNNGINNAIGNNGYRYNISNPAWNKLINSSRNHNLISNSFMTPIRSYPYGYPPGYAPKTNGYNVYAGYNNTADATPGYTNANSAPYFYNYQYPNRQNFGGYYGYNASRPGYNNFNSIPAPYSPGYTRNPGNNVALQNFTNNLASYPTGFNTPGPNTMKNNENPDNRRYAEYNNTAGYSNNTPYKPVTAPFTEPNNTRFVEYNATTTDFKYTTPVLYNPGNMSTTPEDNAAEATTPNIATACVICRISCPTSMHRKGWLCVADNAEDDY